MGYESRIYIVNKTNLVFDGMVYAEKIAEFNLCKMNYKGSFHSSLDKMRETGCYIFSDDGNTKITEDCYGDKLKEIGLRPFIKIMEKEDKGYRRIQPLINLLKSFDNESWKNIYILHYGY